MGKLAAWLSLLLWVGCGSDASDGSEVAADTSAEVAPTATTALATDTSEPSDTGFDTTSDPDTTAPDSTTALDSTTELDSTTAPDSLDDTGATVEPPDTSTTSDDADAPEDVAPEVEVVTQCPPNPVAPWSRRIRPAGGAVVLNEVMGASGVEWIELYNPMVVDVDLSDWRIDGRVTHTFEPGTFILGRGYLVIQAPWERTAQTERLELRNNMDRLMDVLDSGDAPLWPTPSAAQSLAKRDPETLSALAEHWLAAAPTPGAVNVPISPLSRSILINRESLWQYDAADLDLPGFAARDFDDGAWASGEAPFHAGVTLSPASARVTADNFFAVYLGAADGSNMRYVGRDQVGGWDSAEDLQLATQPGDHLYIVAWEAPGNDGGPQMMIAEVTRAGAPVVATATNTFEWLLGPTNASPNGDLVSPVPTAAVISGLAAGTFASAQASRANGSSPWGTLPFDSATYLWGDTFDNVSATNSSNTFALFRSRAPIADAAGTEVTPVPATTYFRKHFTFDGDPDAVRLWLTLEANNGAVVYLNGAEVRRHNLPEGALDHDTSASGPGNTITTQVVPAAALLTGDNVIAVAVHQFDGLAAERDTLRFDLTLEAEPVAPAAAPSEESDLVINELMYHPIDAAAGAASDWIELYNRGSEDLDLTGWQLVDGVTYAFPAGTTVGPGEHLVLAQDLDAMARDYPSVVVAGELGGGLANDGERVALLDRCGTLVDEVRYVDGGRWPSDADGAASSLELRDAFADNRRPEAWAASYESDRVGWQTVTYRGVAAGSPVGPDGQWRELIIGLLDEGVVLLDDIRVVVDPDAASATQIVLNGTFELQDPPWGLDWNAIGTHERTSVVPDPDDPSKRVLRVVATGPTEHMHNQLVTTTRNGYPITNGSTYDISMRARWVSGSDQLNTRLYFNRMAKTTRLGRPLAGGTPGAPNSTAVANLGPTFHDLAASPVVPRSSEPVVVSVGIDDPDGVETVTLFAALGGVAFQTYPMAGADGRWEAVLPPQPNGALMQFYVVAVDARGAGASFPAAGADSRALYRVDDSPPPSALHSLRILMTGADANHFHAQTNVMSNAATPVTIVYDGRPYYDVGVRAKGSERGRPSNARLGFSLRFDRDDPFRGVYHSVSIDRSEGGGGTGQREMMIDQVMAHAGSVSAEYNDLVQLIAPRPEHSGQAGMQTGRFTDVVLDNQFEDGADGELFEYELIYYPTTTDDGTPNGLKLPQPDNVVGTNHRDLGDDPEAYRHTYLVKNNRGADDFSTLIAMCKVFGKNDNDFRAQVANVIDVDQWLRAFAFMSLSGASDNYGSGAQHNAQLYVRPSDGRVLLFAHDLDLYGGNPQSAIVGQNDLSRLLAMRGSKRIFYGYLYDFVRDAHSVALLDRWRAHFAALLPGQNFTSHYDFMVARRDWILNSASNSIAATFPNVTFAITTNGGQAFTSGSAVSIEGDGWIDVRDIVLVSGADSFPLVVEWTDETRWRIALTLPPGSHTVTLEAHDTHGDAVGGDDIVVTVSP